MDASELVSMAEKEISTGLDQVKAIEQQIQHLSQERELLLKVTAMKQQAVQKATGKWTDSVKPNGADSAEH